MIADADRKLREAAQLWALARKLPHLPTDHELMLLREFERFSSGQAAACSKAAATAGLQALWARQDLLEIVRIGRMLSREYRCDREIRTCISHARRLVGAIRRRHRWHRHATTGLNDLLNAWDPIGVADSVPDEYASYAPAIMGLLAAGASEERIADELSRIACEKMGLQLDPHRHRTHAAAIVGWYGSLQTP